MEQRGRQLTFVAQVAYLALQPELYLFQKKATQWVTKRLSCRTGLRSQSEAMRTLLQTKAHTEYLEKEITSARTILQSDKIVQIFGTETLQDELIDTLSEILEGQDSQANPE